MIAHVMKCYKNCSHIDLLSVIWGSIEVSGAKMRMSLKSLCLACWPVALSNDWSVQKISHGVIEMWGYLMFFILVVLPEDNPKSVWVNSSMKGFSNV